MRKLTLLLTVIASLFLADPAFAQMKAQGVYLGVAGGGGFQKTLDGSFDDAAVAYKFIGGFRTKFFAIEGDYRNMGSIVGAIQGLKSKTAGFQASGLLMIPVGPVDFYGRGGAFFWTNEITAGTIVEENTGTDLGWGGGIAFRIGSASLRFEYERAEIKLLDKPWIATAGLTFAF